jgi:hypothetical protein
MTLSIKTLSITIKNATQHKNSQYLMLYSMPFVKRFHCYAECWCSDCRNSERCHAVVAMPSAVVLTVFILNVDMLCRKAECHYYECMMGVVMLTVIMLTVTAPYEHESCSSESLGERKKLKKLKMRTRRLKKSFRFHIFKCVAHVCVCVCVCVCERDRDRILWIKCCV